MTAVERELDELANVIVAVEDETEPDLMLQAWGEAVHLLHMDYQRGRGTAPSGPAS